MVSGSVDNMKAAFGKKFTDKSKNRWQGAATYDNFQTVPGKYTMLQMNYDDDDKEGGNADGGEADKQDESVPDSQLPDQVQVSAPLMLKLITCLLRLHL